MEWLYERPRSLGRRSGDILIDRQTFDRIVKATPAHIHQDVEEFWKFLEIANPINPQRILEIGVCHGGTTLFFQEMGEQVIGLDYHKGLHPKLYASPLGLAGGIPDEQFHNVEFVIKDSHDSATLEIIKSKMPEIDLLFIDGDHTYSGCKMDWEMYSPLVRLGGIVAFHDTNYGRHQDPDSAIKSGQVFDEIVGCRKQEITDVHGIGIVWVGQEPT